MNKEALRLNNSNLPFKVVVDKFKYFGVCVTREYKNLYKFS